MPNPLGPAEVVAQPTLDDENLEQASGAPITALAFLEEAKKVYVDDGAEALCLATLNENFMEGRQWMERNQSQFVFQSPMPSHIPRIHKNLLHNLALTWAARMTKDRPDIRAWPATADMRDIKAAEVANALLEYYKRDLRYDALVSKAAVFVQPHGSIGFRVMWDAAKGPLVAPPTLDGSPSVPAPQGDVVLDVVTVYNFWTSGEEDIERAQWCVFRSFISVDDARTLLLDVGVTDEPVTEAYSQVMDGGLENGKPTTKKGVPTFEIWHKPTARFPKGWKATIVSNHVVELFNEYPYDHEELPLAIWKCDDMLDSQYGNTHFNDAVPLQRALNDTKSTINRLVRLQGDIRGLVSPEVADEMDTDVVFIKVTSPEAATINRWLDPPPISKD